MHQLMQRSTLDRLVVRAARSLFEPTYAESSGLPLVLDARPHADLLEHDLNLKEWDDPFAIGLFFYCVLTEQHDSHIWEALADVYLDGRLSVYTNLYYQLLDTTNSIDIDPDEFMDVANRLHDEAGVSTHGDSMGNDMYYLHEMVSVLPYMWMQTEPEYMLDRYMAFFTLVSDHLEHVDRLTCLWNRLAQRYPLRVGETMFHADYSGVATHAAHYLRAHTPAERSDINGLVPTPEMPRYMNPYKGGGFTCTN